MAKTESFAVTIRVTAEQLEMLKDIYRICRAEAEEQGEKPTFDNWKDYARTCAAVGFDERLRRRHADMKPTQ